MIAVDANRFGACIRTPRPWHTYALMLLCVPMLALIVASSELVINVLINAGSTSGAR